MSTKRKRSILSIQDKQSIILRLEKGEKGTSLSNEYGVSKQQISDIRKNKVKIMKFADNLEIDHELKRKSLKVADDEQLDEPFYARFIQQKTAGTPISGPLLQEKAKHFHGQLHVENANGETFKASTGWLESSVEDESSDEEDESRDEQTVTKTEAAECFKKCLTWMERQNNVEAIQLMQLRRMMELATRTRCRKNLKQTDLLEHFRQK